MKRVKVTRRARVDLLKIWNYIAEDSFDAADKVIGDIRAAFQSLAEMPGMGHTRADIDDPRYRFWRVHSYLIAYRPDTKPIQIIRVVSAYRDMGRLFS